MAPHIYLNPFFQKNFTQNQSYGIDMDYITLTQRLWDKKKPTFIGAGNCEKHICLKCGWPFPNPYPSVEHRREHKKVCGTIEGYAPINLKGKSDHHVFSSKSHEVGSPNRREPYVSHNAISPNMVLENATMVTNKTTFACEASRGEDTVGDHEKDKTEKCDLAKNESKEENILLLLNLVLENATMVRNPSYASVDVEVNQAIELIGGDNPGDHEKDKIEKRGIVGNEIKENSLSKIESARNLGQTESNHYTSFVSEFEVVVEDSTRNMVQTEPKLLYEIEFVGEDETEDSKRKLGQTKPVHYKTSVSEIEVIVEDERNEIRRNFRQTDSYHCKSSLSPQNNCFQEGIQEFEFYDNCEIQEECAEESSIVAKISCVGDAELLHNVSQKVTLKDILRFPVGDESSSQSTAAVTNNRTKDYARHPSCNSYESSRYEGFSSQRNALSDVDAEVLTSTDSYRSSEAKKADMKNPNLDDYERRTCKPLFDMKGQSNDVFKKSQWRKKVASIFRKVVGLQKKEKNVLEGLLNDEVDLKSVLRERSQSERKKSEVELKPQLGRLSCCSSSTVVIISHKKKDKGVGITTSKLCLRMFH